jgi:hypothetical protein
LGPTASVVVIRGAAATQAQEVNAINKIVKMWQKFDKTILLFFMMVILNTDFR